MAMQARSSRPGPRRTLTEDEIMDAALDLLNEGGVNAASVRGSLPGLVSLRTPSIRTSRTRLPS